MIGKQPIIALYFEFENELKFYNLKARSIPGFPIFPIIALYFEFENELKFYNLKAWINSKSEDTNTIIIFTSAQFCKESLYMKHLGL